jgi:hypothetical protein
VDDHGVLASEEAKYSNQNEFLESPEADETAADGEEGFVDLVAAVVADEQPLEVVEPGEGCARRPSEHARARSRAQFGGVRSRV